MIIDAHVHLAHERFEHDRIDVLERAWENFIRSILTVNTLPDEEKWEITKHLLEEYGFLWGCVGLHPRRSHLFDDGVADFLHEAWQHPYVVAIGETGLDYYYLDAPKDTQQKVFEWHVYQAKVHDLPLVVHTREAHEDTLAILRKYKGDVRGMIHCFSGDKDIAKQYLDLDFYLSFSGLLTFPNMKHLKDVVDVVPIDRILVETDSPYLTPHPYQGRRNEPAYVLRVVDAVAKIKNMNIKEVKDEIYGNFHTLFRIREQCVFSRAHSSGDKES